MTVDQKGRKKVLVRNHVKFSEEKKTIFDILGFKTNPGLLFKLKIPFSCIHIFFRVFISFLWNLKVDENAGALFQTLLKN